MERLVTVRDVADRYGVTTKTAGRYLRQMFHYENPLAAPRWAFDEWERSREVNPGTRPSRSRNQKQNGRTIVPRKRGQR